MKRPLTRIPQLSSTGMWLARLLIALAAGLALAVAVDALWPRGEPPAVTVVPQSAEPARNAPTANVEASGAIVRDLPVPLSVVTVAQAQAALEDAGMEPWAARTLAQAAANCEAPALGGIDLRAVGDEGRARGPFQIRGDVHRWTAGFDLENLDIAAAAAVRIYREGGLVPWSCVR